MDFTTLCDASPLIFLAKIDLLDLLHEVPGGRLVVLNVVKQEVLADPKTDAERTRLEAFLQRVHMESMTVNSKYRTGPLSENDRACLAWAIENRAKWMVGDERFLRRAARAEGVRVIGFIGVLLESVRRKIIPASIAEAALDDAVTLHNFRVSLPLYRRILKELGRE